MPFWEYELHAQTLCLGERIKGGLFRPCDTHVIRYSAATGALRERFGWRDLHATGYFVEKAGYNQIEYLVYSPRDDISDLSKLPLTVQFLADALGTIIVKSQQALPEEFELSMGALKSQGFGRCHFRQRGEAAMEQVRGRLRTRVPEHRAGEFEISKVVGPVYGYLFEPTAPDRGEYVRSLFEGSEVYGPRCLVEEQEEEVA